MARDWDAFLAPGRTLIMGILNATPDSFFRESRVDSHSIDSVGERATAMVHDGADCIDIGAESTRPGAIYLEESEEIERLIPVLKAVRSAVNVPISVDTRKARVARVALDAGADIINDISAGEDDENMFDCARELSCPVVLMHKQGTPESMQAAPHYKNTIAEICSYLAHRAEIAKDAGIQHIIVDPGLGFGKRFEDNLDILCGIEPLIGLGYPLLIGHSRKGFVGAAISGTVTPADSDDRLYGSLAVSIWCAERGVSVLRVHDVKAHADALRVYSTLATHASLVERSLHHA